MTGGIILYLVTFFAATCCGVVLLIQQGGWLATLSAILILMSYFITGSLALVGVAAAASYKEKYTKLLDNKKEEIK